MKQWIFIICLASMALASCKNEAAKTEAPKAE